MLPWIEPPNRKLLLQAARGSAVEFFRRDAEKHKPLHKDDTQKQLWPPDMPWLKVTKICGGQCAALAGEVKEV